MHFVWYHWSNLTRLFVFQQTENVLAWTVRAAKCSSFWVCIGVVSAQKTVSALTCTQNNKISLIIAQIYPKCQDEIHDHHRFATLIVSSHSHWRPGFSINCFQSRIVESGLLMKIEIGSEMSWVIVSVIVFSMNGWPHNASGLLAMHQMMWLMEMKT